MNLLEWMLLAFLSMLFGSSFFFIGVAVKELPTFTIVVSRVVIAATILLVAMRVMGTRIPTDRRLWAAFFALALLNNVIPFSLIVWGQEHVASGVAAVLNATTTPPFRRGHCASVYQRRANDDRPNHRGDNWLYRCHCDDRGRSLSISWARPPGAPRNRFGHSFLRTRQRVRPPVQALWRFTNHDCCRSGNGIGNYSHPGRADYRSAVDAASAWHRNDRCPARTGVQVVAGL